MGVGSGLEIVYSIDTLVGVGFLTGICRCCGNSPSCPAQDVLNKVCS